MVFGVGDECCVISKQHVFDPCLSNLGLQARSHCPYRCKEGVKRKKILPSVGKRYASVVSSLHTCFIRSIHRASVHCDFIRAKSFELHKTFRTDELSAMYDVNPQQIRATNVLCPLLSVKRPLYPLCILWASSQLTSAAVHGTSIYR